MDVRRYAGVIVMHGSRVALVRERHQRWGGAYWSIPSGRVESRETPALGAARELAEETGLVVTPDDLQLVGTSSTTHGEQRSLAWNFSAVVDDPALAVDDPDDLVLEARWFTRDEAVAVLRRLPYRPLCEPVIGYLTGSVEPGSHWRFDGANAAPVVTPWGGQ